MNNNTPNYNFLYQQKCEEYDMLNDEYQEMKDISSQIEKELETEVEHLTKEKQRLLAENEKVQNQIKELKKKYSSEIIYLEKKMDLLTGDNTRIQEELRTKNRIITQNEIEVERLESQLRESQCIINDLEYKIDLTLEKLAMVQSQLEENKAYNEEEVQRLKEKLRESQSEVLAYRTREAKQEQTSRMEAENVYIDEGAKQYAAYQANGQRDPSPIKKVKVELGKRAYRQLYVESSNKSKRAQESNNGPVFHKSRSYNSTEQNNNGFQDSLRDLYSLNMMNQTNNKSLLIVNDLIGELDKHSRKPHHVNLQNNQNMNPNIMMNAENEDLFKANVNLNLDQTVSNNLGNIFSNINQQPTFTNFFENA